MNDICPTCGAPVAMHYDEEGLESHVTPLPDPRVVELWRAAESDNSLCAGEGHTTCDECLRENGCRRGAAVEALRDEMEARDGAED